MSNQSPSLRAAEKIVKQFGTEYFVSESGVAEIIAAEYASAEAIVEWARHHAAHSTLDGTVGELRALLATYDAGKDQGNEHV